MSEQALFVKHTLKTFSDERGDLTVLDRIDELVDWPVKRSYWSTNTRLPRGGHCVKGERKFYVMAQGSCKARIYDGKKWTEIVLNGPADVLELKADLWREFVDFTENSVMFTLCNLYYDKSLYILDLREYENYIKLIRP